MDTSFKNIFKASGAAAFGQVLNVVNQLILVPVYIKFWGPHLYGEWLILSAAPSVIAMAGDLGFGTVAANEMNLSVAKGNKSQALKVFQNAWLLITSFSILSLILASTAVNFFSIDNLLNITDIDYNVLKLGPIGYLPMLLQSFLQCIKVLSLHRW